MNRICNSKRFLLIKRDPSKMRQVKKVYKKKLEIKTARLLRVILYLVFKIKTRKKPKMMRSVCLKNLLNK
jgi:hypothetical protein